MRPLSTEDGLLLSVVLYTGCERGLVLARNQQVKEVLFIKIGQKEKVAEPIYTVNRAGSIGNKPNRT